MSSALAPPEHSRARAVSFADRDLVRQDRGGSTGKSDPKTEEPRITHSNISFRSLSKVSAKALTLANTDRLSFSRVRGRPS